MSNKTINQYYIHAIFQEFGSRRIPIADFNLMKEMALKKEENGIPWSLGKQILMYFFSGEADQIYLQSIDDPEKNKELKSLRREINSM